MSKNDKPHSIVCIEQCKKCPNIVKETQYPHRL